MESALYDVAIVPPSERAHSRMSGLSAAPGASLVLSHFKPSSSQIGWPARAAGDLKPTCGGLSGGGPAHVPTPAIAASIAAAVCGPISPSTSRPRLCWK